MIQVNTTIIKILVLIRLYLQKALPLDRFLMVQVLKHIITEQSMLLMVKKFSEMKFLM